MKSRLVGSIVFISFCMASVVHGADLCLEYAKSGEYDKAIDACTEAVNSADYGNYVAYDNRGFAYSKKGQYDKAISDFTKALELNPKDSYAYSNRAFAYEAAKQYEKAIADWGKAIDLVPAEYFYLNRARLYRNSGLYDDAIADYGKVIELNPSKATGYWYRAAVYYEAGLFERDVRDYRKLLELYPKDFPDIKLDLLYVRLLNAAGKLSKEEYGNVLKELTRYVSSNSASSDDEKWWRTISLYYLGNDSLLENKLLAEAQGEKNTKKLQDKLCDAYYAIGEKRLLEGDRKAAGEFFNKSIETGVYSYSSRFAKAMLRLMQERKI